MINENAEKISIPVSQVLEDLICALIRNIDPITRDPIVFSYISQEFKTISSGRFSDIFSVKPGEFAAQYFGHKIVFSRDHNNPPLLQCSRVVGPWTPIPPPTEELLSWAQEVCLSDIDKVDFASAGQRFGDLHSVILTWFRTRATLAPQNKRIENATMQPQRPLSSCRYVRQPNDSCRIGSVHTGVFSRVAESGRGIVVLFTGAEDNGISGYLPATALPANTDLVKLLSQSGEFVIAGRRLDKILLELAKPLDFPALSLGVIQGTIYRVGEIESEVRQLKSMLQSLDDSLIAETVPLAERVLAKSLSKIISSAIKIWNGRGLTVREIAERGASIFHFPKEIDLSSDERQIPYEAVIKAIKALRQDT